MQQWLCPLCTKWCDFGTRGCNDPLTCAEDKNINWHIHYKPMYENGVLGSTARAIGIAAISNEDDKE